ncbi:MULTISPECIES: dTDP-4-dehydrorhamnose reductase [unclassified Rhizobium]|uniref:dTDP-4-dehydrorhamnose reductase n=1 Tax=unclassified Rhizobium TaxID=2613769 RepID=UPI000CDF31F4|nr:MULTISPECIES: dTDP-4-dehydrorhamnose reductase [Rhizobium]AVA23579.1 dTDP-4-dehydrorhamnose reductase [Rhizobium sp. NXC24]MDK4739426.1 dTDP-4-dehydrorhamnose reductase [Rhizobium sp. CNPSo 3464]UWU20912.1 dTDP-4-dehydrorhamnose reductase [Rhizobium tropici]
MSALLITGANGQVGFELQRSLASLGQIIAATRAEMDLADEASILSVLREHKPAIIVNPAAYTAVDRAESEREQAMAVNAAAPGVLARWAADNGAYLLHYSTDYLFDGMKADPYAESDPVNPQSVYGESKWLGEEAVRAAGANHVILRTSWVYGHHGNNFLKTILRLAQERSALNVVADQVGAPTSAALIADVTRRIIEVVSGPNASDVSGTYHLSAGGNTSWHGYATHIVREASAKNVKLALTPDALKPISTAEYPTPAKRPQNSRLDCAKLTDCFDLRLPAWQEGVNEVIERLARAIN